MGNENDTNPHPDIHVLFLLVFFFLLSLPNEHEKKASRTDVREATL
jgi:hypothetical protein